MPIPSALTAFITKHPASSELLTALAPLIMAREKLAASLPRLDLPAQKKRRTKKAVPLFPLLARNGYPAFLDAVFLARAPEKLGAVMRESMPGMAAEIDAALAHMREDEKAAETLAVAGFCRSRRRWEALAAKQGLNRDVAGLFAVNLAACAARRAALALLAEVPDAPEDSEEGEAEETTGLVALPVWKENFCPVCGNKPSSSIIRGKQGRRSLHCSLCGFEWVYNRTKCPSCLQEELRELPVYYDEKVPYERVEACSKCSKYILGIDMRQLTGDIPVEVRLLGMLPLELAMQKNGFEPMMSVEE